jgi:TolB-like protein/DNA-binding winged helix-turn-helix (wHTH) protein
MGNAVPSPRLYHFGRFIADAHTGELTEAGIRKPLRDQSFQLLLALLERPQTLITREELAGRLWPAGTFVDFDRGLNKVVNHLREALGDSADHPRFVETLPRRGYRFIAPVTAGEIESDPPAPSPPRTHRRGTIAVLAAAAVAAALAAGAIAWRWASPRGTPARIAAIAVIPLDNLSPDADEQYFADGLTDALITDLAKAGSVRVTSRTSTIQYRGTKKTIKEIGRELNVDAVVEGTVTHAAGRVRVTAQLIQVSTDMHLWAKAYERDVREILALQRALATDIARQIDIFLEPIERTPLVNPEAYGRYLRGRYAFYQYTSAGWQEAIKDFNEAIALDPGFAPAHSGLAETYLVAGAYGAIPTEEAFTRGKGAAAAALQRDDSLASAHYALGTAHAWYDWDWAGADRDFRRGLELNPQSALGRNWYAGYLSLLGRHDEAIAEHQRARELDPLSLIVNANLTRGLYWARRYDEAIAQGRTTLELDPGFGVALFWLEGALRHTGRFDEAVALREAASPERAPIIGRTYQHDGFDPLMRESAERFAKGGFLTTAARCYAQIGERDEALRLLDACAQRRCSNLVSLNVEPDFDALRDDPRFQRLVRQVGLR